MKNEEPLKVLVIESGTCISEDRTWDESQLPWESCRKTTGNQVVQHTPSVSLSGDGKTIHKIKRKCKGEVFQFTMPIMALRNFWKRPPCKGFVMKSPHMSSVGRYLISRLPLATWSARKKYRMLRARVLLLELLWPLVSRRMALLLSW